MVHAQSYPIQPIRLLVPFAPGGGMESAVRLVTQKVTESGWPSLVVDNRPGGAGTVAALATKQAQPDGYTLMLVALSTHAINVSLMPDLKYDPTQGLYTDHGPVQLSERACGAREFSPPSRSPISWRWRKRNRAASISARPGTGTVAHILGLMLQKATNSNMVHVPYRGGGPAMLDLLAGRIDFIDLKPV